MFVAKKLDIEVKKILTWNTTRHKPYRRYYNEESEENIRNFYREDFERFGYYNHILH